MQRHAEPRGKDRSTAETHPRQWEAERPGERSGLAGAPGTWSRLTTGAGLLQAKLTVNAPGDRYEQEADRVAERVLRMPDPAPVQRKCAACEEEETLQAKQSGGAAPSVAPRTESRIASLRGGGRPLPEPVRSYFEPRFGRDFDKVRVHTGGDAATAAREVRARAFTVGSDVAFAAGEYRPETTEGRRLLAHELVHTVQQGVSESKVSSPSPLQVAHLLPAGTIAGDWIIENPSRSLTARGKTDAEYVEEAFGEICGLANRSGDRIQLGTGPPNPSQVHGCACLKDIETDLASPRPTLGRTPRIRLGLHGWSFTNTSAALVSPRHPGTEFEWGYWTGGQTRHRKPFWQTVAHEVCGHMATFVRTGGAHAGGRRSGQGHNPAIEEENRIAGEHGVPVAEQRDLDVDPTTGQPLTGHRGESFLAASIVGFAHASAALPSTANAVVQEAVATIQTVASRMRTDLMVQVEGKALSNEGGASLAMRRAEEVRQAVEAELNRRSISLSAAVGGSTQHRFRQDVATVLPGSSVPQTSDPDRRVEVYLFHKLHSAGP